MRHFEQLYSIAVENNGIVTNADAARVGVTTSEVARYLRDGRLQRLGYGVYLPRHYVPTRLTRYAAALALVGKGSFICGPSVVQMLGLVREDASEDQVVHVATTRRVRRRLPEWVCVRRASKPVMCVEYDGLPSQPVGEAMRECVESLASPALQAAVGHAFAEGLLTERQCAELGLKVLEL